MHYHLCCCVGFCLGTNWIEFTRTVGAHWEVLSRKKPRCNDRSFTHTACHTDFTHTCLPNSVCLERVWAGQWIHPFTCLHLFKVYGAWNARFIQRYEFQDYNYWAQGLNNECDVFQVVAVTQYSSWRSRHKTGTKSLPLYQKFLPSIIQTLGCITLETLDRVDDVTFHLRKVILILPFVVSNKSEFVHLLLCSLSCGSRWLFSPPTLDMMIHSLRMPLERYVLLACRPEMFCHVQMEEATPSHTLFCL